VGKPVSVDGVAINAQVADDICFDGRSGCEVRHDYPTLQARLRHGALARVFPGNGFAVLTPSAYTGTSPYAVFWGGRHGGKPVLRLRRGHGPRTTRCEHHGNREVFTH
jgi:hypothetical protein